MVDGSGTEFAIKFLGPEASQVVNGVGPKVQHVVPGEGVSFLNHHHFGAHQSELDGGAQTAGASSDDEALEREGQISLIDLPRHGKTKKLATMQCHRMRIFP